MNTFDITILGGGMVGASLAAGLIDSSHTIELIDKNPLPPQKDHRLIALTKSSCDFFKSISIWENLLPFATAIKTVHVSQRGHFGSTRLSAKEIGASELGFVIPAEHINRVLYEKISQAKNITLKPNTTISNMSLRDLAISPSSHPSTSPSSGLSTSPSSRLSISPSSRGLSAGTREVKLDPADKPRDDGEMDKPQDDGETSKLRDNGTNSIIIAADGTHSTLRTQLNIPTETVDYEQRALVTVTHLQRDHDNIAYERFHKTGALALLPLQNNCAATIWTDTEKNIEALLQLSDEEFVINLQHQMGYRLGRFLKIEKRYTYPLKYICMQPHQQIQDNVIFIGNAAHTIHPIAAQGLNIALSEITFLIDHFKSSLTVPRALPEQKNIRLSHQLTQIFAIDFLPFNFARQTGIALLDIFAPAKKKFIRRMIASS